MSLGEALGRILGDKFRSEKNDEKKEVKGIASAGDADPGQDPPAGFLKHDSARLRSPGGRGAGGLNRQSRDHRPPIELEGLVRMVGETLVVWHWW